MISHRARRRLEHSHNVEAIYHRLLSKKEQSYLRDFIYGAIDGIVTTFAVVAGVMGAGLSSTTIIILGLSNIIADGFSMAASNYLGTKSELDERELIERFELESIRNAPEGEREEIRQIFLAKGLEGEVLDEAVVAVTKNEQEWLKLMLQEEYGLGTSFKSPFYSGLATFIAFVFFGALPLLPFIFEASNAFQYSIALSLIAFFSVGSLKSKWSLESAITSGLKTLMIGIIASVLAYLAGDFLEQIVLK